MPLILFYDFETTGLPLFDQPSEDPRQPHAVQQGFILCDSETGEELSAIETIIKPDGWEWDDTNEAFKVHGITMERALAEGIPEKDAIQLLLDAWRQAGNRCGHNERFDARIARIGLKRYFTDELADEWKAAKADCTGLITKPIMQMPPKGRYGYKMPKLVEAYQHFMGKPLEAAHSALADARGSKDVYFAIKAKGLLP